MSEESKDPKVHEDPEIPKEVQNQPEEGKEMKVQEESTEYSPNHAKTDQSVLDRCQFDYEIGNFKSISELARRYGIHEKTLHARIVREDWEKSRLERLSKIESKIVKKTEDIALEYLSDTFIRTKRYQKLIDVSIQNRTKKDENGDPMLDPDDLNTYTLTEARLHEMAKSALRIPDAKAIDITSKGQSLGESFTSALAKLRKENAGKTHELTPEDVKRLSEADIVD